MSLEEARSPATSAKQRVRGPSVLERQRDEEKEAALRVELAWPSRKPASAKAVLQSETAASGGKSIKTGMLLARAQLSESTSGVVAARERQNSLLGKGLYRESEKVAREAAVGTLSVKDMPKRKEATHGSAPHKMAFGSWMRSTLGSNVEGASLPRVACVV